MLRSDRTGMSLYLFNLSIKNKRLKLAPVDAVFKLWTIEQKSAFIESVILGIPMPKIYLIENNNGVRFAFDGYNRIDTLTSFHRNEFQLTSLSILKKYEGFYFKDISPLDQANLEDRPIDTVTIQPPNDKEIMYEMLKRFNHNFIDKETFLSHF